jgi:hypothetical protein
MILEVFSLRWIQLRTGLFWFFILDGIVVHDVMFLILLGRY